MHMYPRRTVALSALCMLILASCASHPHKMPPPRAMTNSAPQQHPQSAPVPPASKTGTTPDEQLPPAPNGMVGVASCDQYLSTYKACHRAAGIFAPSQIDARYEQMREALLRDARDPVKRATLDQRCRALSSQLQQALHGKSCDAAPVPPASTGAP